jgi:hypothetical protein
VSKSKKVCRIWWPCSLMRGFKADHFRGCGFESHQEYGFLSPVSDVCCRVEVSEMGRSLLQRVVPSVLCLSVIPKLQQ